MRNRGGGAYGGTLSHETDGDTFFHTGRFAMFSHVLPGNSGGVNLKVPSRRGVRAVLKTAGGKISAEKSDFLSFF